MLTFAPSFSECKRNDMIEIGLKHTSELTQIDGRKIMFKVSAYCGDTLLGEGTHLRFVVDREKFLSKL